MAAVFQNKKSYGGLDGDCSDAVTLTIHKPLDGLWICGHARSSIKVMVAVPSIFNLNVQSYYSCCIVASPSMSP